jgi:hypothetical protein
MTVGKRHPSALRLGPAFASMSVIALLALACFPVLAHAEDSSGVQYSDAIPRVEGDNSPSHHRQTPAKSSSTGKGGGQATTGTTGSKGSTGGSSENESSSKGGGAAVNGNDGGPGQGSPAGSASGAGKTGVQPAGQVTAKPASEQGDGGSSPLVPILVAILVLAAISVAAVMIGQRRQRGPTTPASPKAS